MSGMIYVILFCVTQNIILAEMKIHATSNLPMSTAFVGVCIFFFDSTITMAELATSVMSMKKGAIKPGNGKRKS